MYKRVPEGVSAKQLQKWMNDPRCDGISFLTKIHPSQHFFEIMSAFESWDVECIANGDPDTRDEYGFKVMFARHRGSDWAEYDGDTMNLGNLEDAAKKFKLSVESTTGGNTVKVKGKRLDEWLEATFEEKE
jgi:hypothetical protein